MLALLVSYNGNVRRNDDRMRRVHVSNTKL